MEGWFGELLEDYLRWVARRGRASNTLASWRWALSDFGNYITDVQLGELQRRHIQGWQDTLRSRLAPNSQQVASTALRGFLRWLELEREDLGVSGLSARVATVKTPVGLPRPIPHQDLEQLLTYFARPGRDLARLRTRALFMFLLTSGARITEALQVTRDQVEADRMVVRGKGGSQKLLIISPLARRWLEQYLRARGEDLEPWLWVNGHRRRLSPEGIQRIWTAIAAECGVKRWTHHQLRHTCATELLDRGATELELAEQLGHRGLATIRRYAEVQAKRRREIVSRLDQLVADQVPGRPGILKPLRRRHRRRGSEARYRPPGTLT